MVELTTRILGVSFESLFKKATLQRDAHCDDAAQRCLEAFGSYGLRAAQIALRLGDSVFNYDLSLALFGGNCTFKLSAEKVEMQFQNANSEKDMEVVIDCISKAYEHVPLPEITSTHVTANAHATADSVEAMQQYLMGYANPPKGIVRGGTIAYVLCNNWPEEIRLTLDRSLVFPDGLFLTWSTTIPGGKPSRDALRVVKEAFEEAIMKLDLAFPQTGAK
jgi:hypothetical protein